MWCWGKGKLQKRFSYEVAKMKRAFLLVLFCVVLLAGYTLTRTLLAKEKATLAFHSFDGGGPRYSVVFDSDIVSCEKEKRYSRIIKG